MGLVNIYLHECLIFMVNVGKYTSPIDPMGYFSLKPYREASLDPFFCTQGCQNHHGHRPTLRVATTHGCGLVDDTVTAITLSKRRITTENDG